MRPTAICILLAAALMVWVPAQSVQAQGGPPPAVREAVDAVVLYVSTGTPETMNDLIEKLAPSYRAEFSSESALMRHLEALRAEVSGPVDDVTVEREPRGLVIRLTAATTVTLLMNLDEEAGRIMALSLEDEGDSGQGAAEHSDEPGQIGIVDRAVDEHVQALMGLADDADGAARFMANRMTAELLATRSQEEMEAMLDLIGRLAAAAMVVEMTRDEDAFGLTLGGSKTARVRMQVEEEPPYRIQALSVDTTATPPPPTGPPLTWDSLDERFQEAESEGFAGVVLAIREGEKVLDRAYGMADRADQRPNTTETIFDIGSIPIDFTRAAIFLLLQQDRLELDDPITRFFASVPDDKREITVRHLLEGRSGLQNFHDVPGDEDPDLTWIDRATAERRILAQRLLFPPGADEAPSHSALGLLAAIVERVSETTYEDFLATQFFGPAGMRRTGPYGDDLGLGQRAFAVGYGASSVGEPNIPPNWGPTSWLIKGSGGMVSTPADMHRWFEYVRSGRVLKGAALDLYLDRGSAVGATDRGFFFLHAWTGGDSMVFLAQNAGKRATGTSGISQLIVELVRGQGSRDTLVPWFD